MSSARSASVLLFIFFHATALPVYAEGGEQFLEDIDAWQTDADMNEGESTRQSADEGYQSATDVFPDTTEFSGGSKLEEAREDRTDAFVTVEIDGRDVVLSDVPRSAWFAPYVRDIAERRIVSGYRDAAGVPTGLFGPGDNVTLEQMSKVLLYASGRTTDGCGTGIPLNVTASGAWSAAFVSCAETLQWTVYGDGSADMRRPATRSEVVVTLLEAFGKEPAAPTGNAFTDVGLATQFGAAIEQAKNDGIVSGYTDNEGMPTGMFGPQDPVTRAEFAKMVTIAMQAYSK